MLDQIIQVWNIRGLHRLVEKVYGLANLSLWLYSIPSEFFKL